MDANAEMVRSCVAWVDLPTYKSWPVLPILRREDTHQRRKGETAEPYFKQLAHVAAVLAEAR